MKKYLIWMLCCFLLVGCKQVHEQETMTETVTEIETTTEVVKEPPTIPEKPVSAYVDNTAKITGTFVPENVKEVQSGTFFTADWSEWYTDLNDLCEYVYLHEGRSIVVGEVVGDISYVGTYEPYSANRTGPLYGSTLYTFAVKEVLYGDEIEPESKITVFEPMNGYMNHRDEEGVYFYTGFYGNVAVQEGDKYVLFLNKGNPEDNNPFEVEGDFYWSFNCNMSKYICCDDGLYRRYSGIVDGLTHKLGLKSVYEAPMELATLKARIEDYFNHEGQERATSLDWGRDDETILYSLPIDLDENGTMEEIRVTALGEVNPNDAASVTKFVEDGGIIKFYLMDEKGNPYEGYDSERLLYKDMYGNLQIFLTKDSDGNEMILITQLMENRWLGYYEFNLYDVYRYQENLDLEFQQYHIKDDNRCYWKSVSFTKMKKNPLDTMEDARTVIVPEFRECLEPWITDAVLIVAMDQFADPVVMYSTKENQISANEYFEQVWNREETFVDGEKYCK